MELTEIEQEGSLEWCRAVLWAAQHMSKSRMTQKQAGGLLRYSTWKVARENPKEFSLQLVPKAIMILEKIKPDDDGGVVELEERSVAELEKFLDRAIDEAFEEEKAVGESESAPKRGASRAVSNRGD